MSVLNQFDNRYCLIHHPAGIGDIFFLQTIARKFISMGYEIVWPVRDKLLWLNDYIPDIEFCSENGDFHHRELYEMDAIYVTPDFAYLGIMRPHMWAIGDPRIMSSKYSVLNMDQETWKDGFIYRRNKEKEDELFYNVLGLKDDSEYVYVNRLYNTENFVTDKFDNMEFNYPVIENEIFDGFTPFDWCKVWENAKEIHTTTTCINFILERLDSKAELYYYPHDEKNAEETMYMYSNPRITWKMP